MDFSDTAEEAPATEEAETSPGEGDDGGGSEA